LHYCRGSEGGASDWPGISPRPVSSTCARNLLDLFSINQLSCPSNPSIKEKWRFALATQNDIEAVNAVFESSNRPRTKLRGNAGEHAVRCVREEDSGDQTPR